MSVLPVCTIVVLNQVSPLAPIIIAANRDEFYARPTRPPEKLEGTRATAGVDEKGGGTWMGVTSDGFFTGLTNHRQGFPSVGRVSRGEVVTSALALADTRAVHDSLAAIEPGRHAPFNLLYGTSDAMECAYVRDHGTEFVPLPLGISVLPNDVLGSPAFPKAARAKRLTREVARRATDWPQMSTGLLTVMGNHARAPESAFDAEEMQAMPTELQSALDSLCIHTPQYGTRSFALIALARDRVVRYLHGDGPTCQAVPIDLTALAQRG